MTTEWYRFFWNLYGFTESGVIPVNKGGTGLNTIGNRQIIIGNANNVFEPALLSSTTIAITYPAGFVNLEIGTSGVTPGTYGSASQVGVFTVNQYGVLTAASNTSIGINANQIISGTIASARISGSYTGITGVGTLTAGTWNANTIGAAYGGTGQSTYAVGDMLYATGITALSKLAIGASTYFLTSSGTAPQWTIPSSVTVGTATNLAGGLANQIPYQTGAGATTFMVAPTIAGTYLNWSGSAFQWSSNPLGDVVGPASATDNAVARFDATTGKLIQNSLVIIDDTGSVTGVNALTAESLTVNNNATLGFSNTDTLDVRARIISDLEPNTNNAKDIGTSGRNWRDGFFGRNLDTVNLSVTGTTSFDGSQGTAGQVLTSAGTGATPTWTTPTTGTVTSVTGTSPVVSSGGTTPAISLATAYGDTLNPYASKTANFILAAPNGSPGVPTFRAMVAADVPALAYVTSVSGTGTVNGITLTGTVTSSGNLTLGGTLGGIGNSQLTNSTISGVALGGNLFDLTAGTGVSFSAGTTYNGSAAITINATGTGGTVTSVAALTLGTTGTDLSSTVANSTTTPVITLNVPTASAANRGALSATDWTTFNNKANAFTYTANYIPYGQGTTTPNQSAQLQYNNAGALSVSTSAAASVEGIFTNTNTGVTASAGVRGIGNSTGYWLLRQYGTGVTATVFGIALANYALLASDGASSNGLMLGSLTADPVIFGTNNAERMRIDSSGNVGIGTTSPAAQLDISSGSTSTLRLSNSDTILTLGQITGEISFYQADASAGGTGVSARIGARSANRPDGGASNGTAADLSFFVSGVAGSGAVSDNATLEALTIRAAGNVGVGTTTPTSKLDVVGAATANSFIPNLSTVPTNGMYLPAANSVGFSTATTERMRIDSSGNIGVGSTIPATYGKFAVQSIGVPPTAYLSVLGTGFTYAAGFESSIYLGNYRTDVLNNGQVAGWRFKNSTTNQFGGGLVFQAASSAAGANAPPNIFTTYMTLNTDASLNIAGTALTLGGNTAKIFRNTVFGSNGLTIQGNNNATVNDTNPGASIDVGGGPLTDTFEGNIRLTAYGNTAGGNRNNIIFLNRSGVNAVTERMRIFSSGGVSIANTTDPGAGNLSVTGTIRTQGYTVATLPAAGTAGRRAYVTDALAPTFLTAIVGGGAVVCPVFDNGTVWVAG
jgi:hypothetical protein